MVTEQSRPKIRPIEPQFMLKKPCIEAAPGRASGRRSNPAEKHHSDRLRK